MARVVFQNRVYAEIDQRAALETGLPVFICHTLNRIGMRWQKPYMRIERIEDLARNNKVDALLLVAIARDYFGIEVRG